MTSDDGKDVQPQVPPAWVSVSNLSTLKAVVAPAAVCFSCAFHFPLTCPELALEEDVFN